MFENQLFLRACFQQHGKFIKTLDASRQFGAVQQKNSDRAPVAASRVQESVLNILKCGLGIHKSVSGQAIHTYVFGSLSLQHAQEQ